MRKWIIMVFGLFALGCSSSPEVIEDEGLVGGEEVEHPEIAAQVAQLGVAEAFDLNDDGVDDQKHYQSGSKHYVVRDINFDGTPDIYEAYEGDSLTLEEYDLDLDGQIDVIRRYEAGVIRRKDYAMGFRGEMVLKRYYDAQGELSQVESQ